MRGVSLDAVAPSAVHSHLTALRYVEASPSREAALLRILAAVCIVEIGQSTTARVDEIDRWRHTMRRPWRMSAWAAPFAVWMACWRAWRSLRQLRRAAAEFDAVAGGWNRARRRGIATLADRVGFAATSADLAALALAESLAQLDALAEQQHPPPAGWYLSAPPTRDPIRALTAAPSAPPR